MSRKKRDPIDAALDVVMALDTDQRAVLMRTLALWERIGAPARPVPRPRKPGAMVAVEK